MRSLAGMAAVLLAGDSVAARPVATGDDFRHGLSRWQIEDEGGARIGARDGVLDIDAPHGVTLWYRTPLTGRVTIEYDVKPVKAGGPDDWGSDVNAFWMATDPAVPGGSVFSRRRTGAFADYDDLQLYYTGIGGNRNTTTRLRRYVGRPGVRPILPEHDRSDAASLLVPNRWIHLRLVADGSRVAVERDGSVLFTLTDPDPYVRGFFGLRTTRSHLLVRRLRITALPR